MSAGNPILRYKRNPWTRIVLWGVFYVVMLGGFSYFIYSQSKDINTYGFVQGDIQLATSKTQYTTGDTISYTITNRLASAIALVNNCPQEPLHVYKWENSQWQRIHDTAGAGACAGVEKQIKIDSGQAVTGNFANWKNLFSQPGIYRLVIYASNYTALPYADFQVVAPAAAAPQPTVIYQPVYTPVYIPTPTTNNTPSTNQTTPIQRGGDD